MSIYNIVMNFVILSGPLHFLLWMCQAVHCIFDCGQNRLFMYYCLAFLHKHIVFTASIYVIPNSDLEAAFFYSIATEAEILVISGVPQMTAEAVRETFGVLFKGSGYKLEIDKFAFEDNSVYITFTNPTGE